MRKACPVTVHTVTSPMKIWIVTWYLLNVAIPMMVKTYWLVTYAILELLFHNLDCGAQFTVSIHRIQLPGTVLPFVEECISCGWPQLCMARGCQSQIDLLEVCHLLTAFCIVYMTSQYKWLEIT